MSSLSLRDGMNGILPAAETAAVDSELTATAGSLLLQPGFASTPLRQILIALVAAAIVIVVGRIVLAIAWKLVTIAAVVVALLLLLSTSGIV
ncbi:hypothetical protein SAMN05192561_10449 [Halopenitus malekzadehii]|uniref:Uncharacterized protein n=2 Tax=Halopenitus malekzadehii TaxID=1267564 RepID=A0A1H6IYU0_9EURY|nr:hypothetical protein SAMN05192561_10449 [Halopenitus malekzadehii]